MSTMPEQANVVMIGAGIVGNSMAYHLALQGWKDIVLLTRARCPTPAVRPATPRTLFSSSTIRKR